MTNRPPSTGYVPMFPTGFAQSYRGPVFEAEGGAVTPPAAAAPAVATPTPAAAASEPQTFSVDYVRELRAENKGYRLKAQQLEAAANEAKAAADRAAAELTAATAKAAKEMADAVAAANTAAGQRLVRAEIRAGAKEAGLAHADFIKLLDTSAITVDKDGDVVVPADFWSSAKAALPHLFNATGADKGTTHNPVTPPKPVPATGKHARDMTDAEADAALEALVRTR